MTETGGRPGVEVADLEDAVDFALDRVDAKLPAFEGAFPGPSSTDLVFEATDQYGWTPAFWTGQLWLAHEYTGEQRYREVAAGHLDPFRERLADAAPASEDHDLGFLYTLAAWANHDVTGDEAARQAALRAADLLADRFHPEPGVLQAWGDYRPSAEDEWTHGRVIVDTMLNLPLLFRASEATGYDRYREVAAAHARRTAAHLVREDGSTFHTYAFDVETGDPLGGATAQGYADDSCWARGQAWALYGFALAYRHTGESEFLDVARQTADHYLWRLSAGGGDGGEDGDGDPDPVPRWDFDAPDGDEVRDSSAAAIAACGLQELAGHLPAADPDRRRYEDRALATLDRLATGYTTAGADSNGILRAGAYNRPEGDFGECTAWGDYFYLEALVRATRDWTPYW